MNKFQKMALAIGAMGFIAIAPVANAIPITDFVDPTNTTIVLGAVPTPCPAGFTCTTSALSFVHDITDDGFVLGDNHHQRDGGHPLDGYGWLRGLYIHHWWGPDIQQRQSSGWYWFDRHHLF